MERAVGDAGPYNKAGRLAVRMEGRASSTAPVTDRNLFVILSELQAAAAGGRRRRTQFPQPRRFAGCRGASPQTAIAARCERRIPDGYAWRSIHGILRRVAPQDDRRTGMQATTEHQEGNTNRPSNCDSSAIKPEVAELFIPPAQRNHGFHPARYNSHPGSP